jgi:copper chaperone CopZ
VSVAIKKVSGVEDVKVSLNEGSAVIKLRDGNKVDVEQIRDIIRKNGFTPKDAEVKVAGKVVERNGKPALAVNGPDVVYLLEGNVASLKEMTGKQIVLAGQVPETADKNAPPKLVVKEVTVPPRT